MTDECPGVGDYIWLRADGRTRGQAQAAMVAEWGCSFTSLRVRREWIRPDHENESGAQCRRGDKGAVAYWRGELVRLT